MTDKYLEERLNKLEERVKYLERWIMRLGSGLRESQ